MGSPASSVPARYKILSSLVPLLLVMVVLSTIMVFRWRSDYGRLAREKRGLSLALPFLEQARELLERAEQDLRSPSADPGDASALADLAVQSASEALSRAPGAEEGWRIRGRALEILYNFDEARSDYEKSLSLHPESPARFHLGFLLIRQYARARLADLRTSLVNPEELRHRAAELLRRFQAPAPEFQFQPNEKLRFMAGAGVAYALGDFSKVAPFTNTAAQFDAQEWRMPYLRGLAAFERNDTEAALRDLEEALRRAPRVADLLAWRGWLLYRTGRRGEATESLTAALQAHPQFLEAYLARSTLLFEEGLFAEAREDLRICTQLRPSLPDLHRRLGQASYEHWIRTGRAREGDLRDAEAAFTQYLALRPGDPEGHLLRGRVRARLRDFAGAERDLSAAQAEGPGQVEARLLRAEILEAQGKVQEADREYTALIEAAAGDPAEVLRLRAALRARSGRIDEAVADYDRLLGQIPSDAGLHLAKGDALLAAGRLEEALAATDRGLHSAPRNALLRVLRGRILLRKGEFSSALRDAEAALEIDPLSAEALVLRGRARLAAGDRAAAREDLRRALELRPDLKEELGPLVEPEAP